MNMRLVWGGDQDEGGTRSTEDVFGNELPKRREDPCLEWSSPNREVRWYLWT